MTNRAQPDREQDRISRRNFVRVGGAAIAGGAAIGVTPAVASASPAAGLFPRAGDRTAKIQQHRTLGRTGWQVSDIGMGTNRLRESAVVRYALDKGVNIIDTAEGYQRGETERLGSLRLRSHLITKEALDKAVETQKETLQRLGHVLVQMNFISKEDLRSALQAQVKASRAR